MLMRITLLACCLLAGSCTGSSTPSTPTVTTAQIGGVWRGTATTSSVVGGECLASTFASTVGGTSQISTAFTQTGSSVSATLTVTSSGSNLTYSGTVGQSAISMTWSTCSACNLVSARCPTGTAQRDFKIQTGAFNGTVTGNTITGTESESYNVYVAGTSTTVGTMTISNAVTMTRQ